MLAFAHIAKIPTQTSSTIPLNLTVGKGSATSLGLRHWWPWYGYVTLASHILSGLYQFNFKHLLRVSSVSHSHWLSLIYLAKMREILYLTITLGRPLNLTWIIGLLFTQIALSRSSVLTYKCSFSVFYLEVSCEWIMGERMSHRLVPKKKAPGPTCTHPWWLQILFTIQRILSSVPTWIGERFDAGFQGTHLVFYVLNCLCLFVFCTSVCLHLSWVPLDWWMLQMCPERLAPTLTGCSQLPGDFSPLL